MTAHIMSGSKYVSYAKYGQYTFMTVIQDPVYYNDCVLKLHFYIILN